MQALNTGESIMFWIMKVLGQTPRDVADLSKSIKVNWWIQMMGIGFFHCMKRK